MKSVITFSTFTLFASSQAGIIEMKRDFNAMKIAAALQKNDSMTADGLRSISAAFSAVFESFNGYGCWCYFEAQHGYGRGQAVDQVDQFCHDLANGYDCAMMDDASCIPWEVNYVSGIGAGQDNLVQLCETLNPNSECSQVACKVEGLFVTSMFTQVIVGNGVDSQYHNSNFNAESECVTIIGGGPSDKECCGMHPYRKPFHTRGGQNACCAGMTMDAKIYNTLSHDCCFDGSVRDSC